MRLHIVWTIFRKELLETLRDRRTLLLALGVPLLVYPLVVIGMSRLMESQKEAAEARASTLVVWGGAPAGLKDHLEAHDAKVLLDWQGIDAGLRADLEAGRIAKPALIEEEEEVGEGPPGSSSGPGERAGEGGGEAGEGAPERLEPDHPLVERARKMLAAREVDAVVVVWPEAAVRAGQASSPPGQEASSPSGQGASSLESATGQLHTSIYYDSVRDDSRKARKRAAEALRDHRQAVLAARLAERGMPASFVKPVSISNRNVAQPGRRLGQILGSMMPMLLILMSTLGAIYPTIDMTAGEKERGTMQTLLCAPLRSVEILTGKLMAIWVLATMTALINVASLGLTVGRILPKNLPARIDFLSFLPVLAVVLPLILVLAAAFFAICMFARDFKDASSLLTPFYTVMAVLPIVASLPRVELNAWTTLVPVVNIALLIKALLLSEARAEHIFLTMASSFAFGAVAVMLAAKVFAREQISLGGREPLRVVLGLERSRGGLPSAALATVFYAVLLVVSFYGTLLLETKDVPQLLIITQYGLILTPVLVTVFGFGFAPKETFSLRLPGMKGVFAAVLLGLSSWAFAAGVLMPLVPPPGELVKALEKVLLLGDKPGPLWLALLLLSVTPAVVEELCFRGLLLTGFRKLGMVPAILITALMFGLLHGSIFRMLPTFYLGLVMGYAVWKTGSILAGMIIHALNNGLAVLLIHLFPEYAAQSDRLPAWLVVTGSVVMGVGLLLLRAMPSRGPGEGTGEPGKELEAGPIVMSGR